MFDEDLLDTIGDILHSPERRVPLKKTDNTSTEPPMRHKRDNFIGWTTTESSDGCDSTKMAQNTVCDVTPLESDGSTITVRRRRSHFDGRDTESTEASNITVCGDDDDEEEETSLSDMPTIPSLDRTQQDSLHVQLSQAPTVPVCPVATLDQLNDELRKLPVFLSLADIDLGLLTKRLPQPAEVQQDDEVWTEEVLLAEMMAELGSEGST